MKYLLIALLLLTACATEEAPLAPEGAEPEPEMAVEEPEKSAPPETTPKNPNLIMHLTFDNDAADSANNNDGVLKGNAVIKQGKVGNAVYLDGNSYVDFSQETISKLENLEYGTIAFWFNYESILDKQVLMPIFYFGVEEKATDSIYIIEIGHFKEGTFGPNPDDKKLYSTWMKGNNDPVLCYDSNENLEENKWHHFAVVVSDKGNTGYLNGVEITDRRYNFGNPSDSLFFKGLSGKTKLMIGYGRSSWMISPEFTYYKGYVDDFRIYNKALTANELKQLI